jgi:hypothetical protein
MRASLRRHTTHAGQRPGQAGCHTLKKLLSGSWVCRKFLAYVYAILALSAQQDRMRVRQQPHSLR